jgi:hypothetical protein
MGRVTFCDTPDELLGKSKEALQGACRAFVLVEAPTAYLSSFSYLLETAKQICDMYLDGTGSVRDQCKLRIVVLVGRRLDLLAKTEERANVLWPKWSNLVIQLKKRDTQSHKVKPAYAVLIAPAQDVVGEPTSIVLPRDSATSVARECLNLRCTESNCPYRKVKLDAVDAIMVDTNTEIGEDDRFNMLETMLGEIDDIEETEPQDVGVDTEEENKPRKHDCIVNLWPYAHTSTYYREILSALASADKAAVAVILSTTAHPTHWMACADDLRLNTFVFTRRWSEHSTAHGETLGKQLLEAAAKAATGVAGVSTAAPEKTLSVHRGRGSCLPGAGHRGLRCLPGIRLA